jgi:4-oxalocrotonate tautomerase
MPLTQISLRRGKSATYRRALMHGVYEAMRETFNVPQDDRFITVSEYDEAQFDFGADYLGIHRTDDLVIIQITANDTRTVDQKKALYAAIAHKLAADPGVSAGDVFINLVEVKKENWSFGNGIAQYA